eukprot:gene18160-19972_t
MAEQTNKDDFAKIGKELYSTVEEHPTPIALKVTGTIPAWFEGSFLRIGPGKFEWGKSSYNHWFDGQSLIHKYVVKDGKAFYSSKYLHSKSYDKSKKYGRVATPGFATWAPPDPCKNIFERFALYFLPPALTDNCNINVVTMKDEAFACSETPVVYHIDTQSMDTLEEEDIKSVLSGPRTLLVHPHQDAENNVYNISTSWFGFKYQIFKIPPTIGSNPVNPFSGAEVVGSVPFSFTGPAYFHSFAMTENYFVLIENPFVLAKFLKMLVMNFLKLSYLDVLKWKPEKMSRMHVVDRKTGKTVQTYMVANFFAFHHVNAYETDNDIIVDVCGYPDASVVQAFYLRNLRAGLEGFKYTLPALRRYTLPIPGTERAKIIAETEADIGYEVLIDGFELPRINYAYNTKKYKYAYGTVFRDKNFFLESISKVNVDTKEVINWQEEHAYPSEPVFIAAPDAKDEDDGIVLSAVVGVLGKSSFLLILDGKTFTEIARAEIPVKLGLTFHGNYFH